MMVLCVNSSILGPSMAFGYSAVALEPMMAPSSNVRIDKVQANWIGWYHFYFFSISIDNTNPIFLT